jgi:hypothetical protein
MSIKIEQQYTQIQHFIITAPFNVFVDNEKKVNSLSATHRLIGYKFHHRLI